jgi:NOL1/NOP2/fmu family ribosome biogenesis protein
MVGDVLSPSLRIKMSVISYPIPAYSNPTIAPQFYQPSVFFISAVTLGNTTTITTTENHNYVIGQIVRLIIPKSYGSYQLNEQQGYVISIPAANQVEVTINSMDANTFIQSPFVATITGATQSNPCVLTANNSFVPKSIVKIENVGGMTQLNGNTYLVLASNYTSLSIDVDSSTFSAYTSGGTITLSGVTPTLPQIVSVGDNNSGVINSSGRVLNGTYIQGSFINIS